MSGDENTPASAQDDFKLQQLHAAALFSLFWSLGSFTNSVSRQKFCSLFWKLIGDDGSKIIRKFDSLPHGCHVYDWAFHVSTCAWGKWSRDLPACNISPASDAASIIVPTVDGHRHASLLRLLLAAGSHVMFVGCSGTGKTVLVTRTLQEGLSDNWQNFMMSLSARATANFVSCAAPASRASCIFLHVCDSAISGSRFHRPTA
jgi:hypothetical protein